nr:ribonuclease H-like domain-containing protein [Tanacetum cinerariifolium]
MNDAKAKKILVASILATALMTKPNNKTPYELLNGRSPRLDFIRPFSYHVTILNSLDPLDKFEGKAYEGFLVGYYVTSKAFTEFYTKTRKVEENLHGIKLTKMQVHKILMAMQVLKIMLVQERKCLINTHHIVLPLWSSISSTYKSLDDKAENDKLKDDTGSKTVVEPINKEDQAYKDELDKLMSLENVASNAANSLSKEFEQGCMDQRGAAKAGSTNIFNTISNPVNASSTLGTFSAGRPSSTHPDAFIPDDMLLHVGQDNSQIPDLEDTAKLRSTCIFISAYDDDLDTFTSPV